MAKIKIGADELILWLRKNDKAINAPNDDFSGLGRKIHDYIVETLNGRKIEDNRSSFWANTKDDKNINKFCLPKTSAQYEIDTSQLETLYNELINW